MWKYKSNTFFPKLLPVMVLNTAVRSQLGHSLRLSSWVLHYVKQTLKLCFTWCSTSSPTGTPEPSLGKMLGGVVTSNSTGEYSFVPLFDYLVIHSTPILSLTPPLSLLPQKVTPVKRDTKQRLPQVHMQGRQNQTHSQSYRRIVV